MPRSANPQKPSLHNAAQRLSSTTASITSITSGGTGWAVGDTLNVTGGGGSGALATVTSVSGGVITGLSITNAGVGYTSAPTALTKATSTSGGGTVTANFNAGNFTVGGIRVTSAGSGYTGTPTATWTGGGSATVRLSSVTLAANSSIGGSGNITIDAVVAESGGSRALTKVGVGSLILTANNTYTGATTINAGTLQLSGSGTIGSGAFSITGGELDLGGSSITNTFTSLTGGTFTNGTVTNNSSNYDLQSGSVSAILAGTNGVNKTTANTVTLSGANTYTGATTINAGTLQIGNGGTTGSLSTSSAITNNGTLAFNRTDTITQGTDFASVISGTGALIKAGSGNLILTGNNTYTGTTTISAGTLQLGTGTAGSDGYIASTSMTNNGTLYFNLFGNQTLTYGISGSGNLIKAGAGTLTISPTVNSTSYSGSTWIQQGKLFLNQSYSTPLSRYTIDSGASLDLQNGGGRNLSIGSLDGAGSVILKGTLTLGTDNTSDANFSGIISQVVGSSGGLTKNGTGTQTLSGNNTYTGTTKINAGTLQIGNGGTTGSLSTSSAIINNGTLTFNRSNTITQGTNFNGTISGTGSLIQAGSGNLILTGANTYAGTTTISSGLLTITSNSSLPGFTTNGRFSVANGATLGVYNAVTDADIASMLGTTNFAAGAAIGFDTTTADRTYSSNLSNTSQGALGLNKTGSNTLTLTGNNTYTGATIISAGTLAIGSSGQLGGGTYAGAIINNGSFNYSGTNPQTLSGVISGTGALTQNGTGTLVLSGANTYTGGSTLNAGTLALNNSGSGGTSSAIGTGTLTIAGGTLDNTSGSLVTLSTNNAQNWNGDFIFTGTNDLNLGTGNVAMNATRAVTVTAGNLTVGGVISGVNFGLTKAGAGTLVLSGNNTYSGTTTLTAGTVVVGSSTAFGTSALTFNGGTLQASTDLTGANALTTTSLHIGANSTVSGANSIAIGGNSTGFIGNNFNLTNNLASGKTLLFTGNLNLKLSGAARTLTIAGSGNTTFSGTLSDTSSLSRDSAITVTSNGTTTLSGAFTSNGVITMNSATGTLVLSGNNTSTGGVTLTTGTLAINNNNALGASGANFTISSGTIDSTVSGISIANANPILMNGNFAFIGTNDLNLGTGNVTMSANRTVAVNAGNLTVGGVISGAAFGLTKNGTGTMILSGANTYAGATTINAGTLRVSALADGATVSNIGQSTNVAGNLILNGGTLQYTGAAVSTDRLFSLQSSSTIDASGTGAVNFTNTGSMGFNSGTAAKTLTLTGSNTDANTLAAVIANNTGATSVIKSGMGSWVLAGANTYSGGTTINAGTLTLGGGSGSAGSGNVSISSGATLGIANSASTTILNNISGAGDIVHTSPTTITSTVSGNNTNTGSIRSTGGGTMLFSGANALSTSITSLNATNGSTLSFADGTTRILTLGSSGISLNTAALSFDVDLSGSTSDRLNFTGAASLTGTNTVNLSFLNSLSGAQTWTLLTAASGLDGGTWSLGTYTLQPGYSFSLSSTATSLSLSATLGSSEAYWTGSGGNSWTATNFSPTVGGAASLAGGALTGSSNVVFAGTGAGNLTSTLGADYSIGTLTVSTPEVAINGSNTLNVTSSSTSGINISATGNTTIGANLAGNAGLSKSGSGTLLLNGSNTYSGGTTITGGTVVIGTSSALGNSSVTLNPGSGNTTTIQIGAANLTAGNNLVLNSGTTAIDTNSFNGSVSGVISSSGALTKLGAGTLTLSGNNSYVGTTTITAGTLEIGSTGQLGGGGNIANNATFIDSSANNQVLSGVISGTGSLIKNGTGTLSLSGNNTYTGTTSINVGALIIQNANSLGSAANGTTVASGAALQLQGGISVGAEALTLSGTGVSNDGALRNITGINSFSGNISLGEETRINSDAGLLTLSGNLSGTQNLALGGAGSITISGVIGTSTGTLTKDGAGTATLSGSNTYTGATTINAGTLQIGNAGTTGSLATSSAITNNGTLAFNRTNTITQGTDFNSVISGTGSLIQAGSGNLILSGANSYSGGTTLSAGTLNINNASAIGTGTLTISGGTLNNTSGSLVTLSTNNAQNWNSNFAFTGTNDLNLGTGNVAMSSARTVTVNGGNLTVGGVVSGATFNLAKAGAGTLILSGANTYSGATTISAGTLSVSTLANGGAASGIGQSSNANNSLILNGGTLK